MADDKGATSSERQDAPDKGKGPGIGAGQAIVDKDGKVLPRPRPAFKPSPFDDIDGQLYMKPGVKMNMVKQWLLGVKERPTVSAIRKLEEDLDANPAARRARYGCGVKFVDASTLQRWPEYSTTTLLNNYVVARTLNADNKAKWEASAGQRAEEDRMAREREERWKARMRQERATLRAAKGLPPEEDSDDDENPEKQRRLREREERARLHEIARKKEAEETLIDETDRTIQFDVDHEVNSKVAIWQGNITHLEVDAIVNAANRSLLGGGGIDGAIHRAAGDWLYEECASFNGADTGDAVITRGYKLPAKNVIHTVGPVGKHPKQLATCYINCLKQLVDNKLKSIAFCGISSGIYGYPLPSAARVALHTVRSWLNRKENRDQIDLIIFCVYTRTELDCYDKLFPLFFPTGVSIPWPDVDHEVAGSSSSNAAAVQTSSAATTAASASTAAAANAETDSDPTKEKRKRRERKEKKDKGKEKEKQEEEEEDEEKEEKEQEKQEDGHAKDDTKEEEQQHQQQQQLEEKAGEGPSASTTEKKHRHRKKKEKDDDKSSVNTAEQSS